MSRPIYTFISLFMKAYNCIFLPHLFILVAYIASILEEKASYVQRAKMVFVDFIFTGN